MTDEVYRNFFEIRSGEYDDFGVLLLLFGCVLINIPCILFNLKTIRRNKSDYSDTDNVVLDDMHLQDDKIRVAGILWISTIIYGMLVLALGIYLLKITIEELPSDDPSGGMIKFAVVFGFIFIGLAYLYDVWRTRQFATWKKQ